MPKITTTRRVIRIRTRNGKYFGNTEYEAELKVNDGRRAEADISVDDPGAHLMAYLVYDNSEGLHNVSIPRKPSFLK